jgi:hypothetical protein
MNSRRLIPSPKRKGPGIVTAQNNTGNGATDVRFGSKADICNAQTDVCFGSRADVRNATANVC